MTKRTITTSYWAKPVPSTAFDWEAIDDNYDLGEPIGYGASEIAAIVDLWTQLADRESARAEETLAYLTHLETNR